MNNYPRHKVGVLKALLLGVLFFFSASAAADQFKPFTVKSFEQIKARYAGQELLVILWSVELPALLGGTGLHETVGEIEPRASLRP